MLTPDTEVMLMLAVTALVSLFVGFLVGVAWSKCCYGPKRDKQGRFVSPKPRAED